ncbi:CBS domain-containing protein [Actinomycetospora sp. OC33-EN08]|uniref:CBS domain-containing protein n=1 Tax=Actinomycetospora aurantiaca TaxID=3129233 RepID=A0ABU8MFK5_9PSEU
MTLPVSTRVVVVPTAATVAEALETMHRERIRHLPVVHGTDCVGLVVQGDLVGVLGADRHVALRTVAGFVHAVVPRVAPSDPPARVARAILDGGLEAALVVERGRLVGIVTGTDALRALVAGDAS